MPIDESRLEQIEANAYMIHDTHRQLADLTGLSVLERALVIARVAYVNEQTARSVLTEEQHREYLAARQTLIERAEQTRAENQAARDCQVNAEGGQG